MAKTSGIVKNSSPVPKTSPRDSQSDLDTVLVVSSEEIAQARKAAESTTSETATFDCHPVILDDTEEETDRFVGSDASSSGLVTKPVKKPMKVPRPIPREEEEGTETMAAPQARPAMIEDDEEIEISLSGAAELDVTPTREAVVAVAHAVQSADAAEPTAPERPIPVPAKAEPRATITEVREVDPPASDRAPKKQKSGSLDDETETEERPRIKDVPRFDDETMPMPKPDLVDIAGALETVPLNSALVQNVIAQVDARRAARAAGQPMPPLNLSPLHPQMAIPAQQPAQQQPMHRHPPGAATTHSTRGPMQPAPAPRRIGIEIVITVLAFLAVAVPALYWLYVSFMS